MLPQGLENGKARILGIEGAVAVAAIVEIVRIVDQRKTAMERFVIEIVLSILPVMRDDRVGILAHDIEDRIARLEAGEAMAHQIEAPGKGDKMGIVLDRHRAEHPHDLDSAGIAAIGHVAGQHRQMAGLDRADVRLEHAEPPAPPPRLIGKARALAAPLQIGLKKARAPQMLHHPHRCSKTGCVIVLAGLFESRQHPDLIDRRAREQLPVRQIEDHALGIDEVIVGDLDSDGPSALRLESGEPFGAQLRGKLDENIKLVHRLIEGQHRGGRVGKQLARLGGVTGPAIDDEAAFDRGRAGEQHQQEIDVLEDAVLPQRLLAIADEQRHPDAQGSRARRRACGPPPQLHHAAHWLTPCVPVWRAISRRA